jgi:hypothetical protein
MVTYRAPISHWSDWTFADLAGFTFEYMAEPSHALELSASIVVTPVTDNSARSLYIITPRLIALAKEFANVLSFMHRMRLFRRIEYAVGTDLDDIWGEIYERRRLYGESDDEYRKRLQIYLLQVAGSGTKAAVEEIISIICECPNSCRIDTYWPGYCRIYITKDSARVLARARTALIDLILPDTLAAGIDYRFYIPYVDLDADMALMGPDYNYLPADIAIEGPNNSELNLDLIIGSRSDNPVDADIYLIGTTTTNLRSSVVVRDKTESLLDADVFLSARHDNSLDADVCVSGRVETDLRAYLMMFADTQSEVDADIALQARRLRPMEARIRLEAVT